MNCFCFLIYIVIPCFHYINSRIPASKEMILNGDFKENIPSFTGDFYYTSNVPHWVNSNVYFEICVGNILNSNWPLNKYASDTDVNANSITSQEFYIDSIYDCQFTMAYSSMKRYNVRDGFYIKFNSVQIFSLHPLPNDSINYISQSVTTRLGQNLLEIGALGTSNSAGTLFTDVSIKCPVFSNYIFFISEGDYELYKDGSIFSSGQVTSAGKYISLGSSIMNNTLLEIKIISSTVNPRFIATLVYNYDNANEYVINTNEHWIVDNFHAIELTDTDHTSNINYGSILDTSAKWIKSSFSDEKETIFTMVTG